MIDVTVAVCTFGTDEWKQKGDEALKSAVLTGAKVLRIHEGNSVAESRNIALESVTTEYIVFLDGDDDLHKDYFKGVEPEADVIVTAITYDKSINPAIWKTWEHERGYRLHSGNCVGKCLLDGNWIHIGAIHRVTPIRFREYPVYEDYAYYLEHYTEGHTFTRSESSIYYASVRENKSHRNHSIPKYQRREVHKKILEDLT